MKLRHIALTAAISSLTTVGTMAVVSSPSVLSIAKDVREAAIGSSRSDRENERIGEAIEEGREPLVASPQDAVATLQEEPRTLLERRAPCAITGKRFKSTGDASPAAELPHAEEVHAIGIYEVDAAPTHFQNSRDRVPVCVDRPGKSVLLLLGSHDPVRWQLQISQDTELKGVVLQGPGARGSEADFYGRYLEEARPPHAVAPEIVVPHQEEGDRFRTYARMMPSRHNLDRLSSFEGAYTAPAAGFRIEAVESDNHRLDPDPLAGKITGSDLLTDHLKTQMESGAADTGWRFAKGGFFGAGSEPAISAPADAQIISPIDRATFDPDGNRLFGLTSHGASKIYRGDLETGAFVELAEMRFMALGGAIWSPDKERLVVTAQAFNKPPQVLLMDPASGQMAPMPLPKDGFIGLSDLHDPGNTPAPKLIPLAIDGDLLVVATERKRRHPLQQAGDEGSRSWLVNLETGDIHLLSYTVDRSIERKIQQRAEDEKDRAARDDAQKAAEMRKAAKTAREVFRARRREMTEERTMRAAEEDVRTGPAGVERPSPFHDGADPLDTGDVSEDALYAQTVQMIQAAISGTKTLYASRPSYFGVNVGLLHAAGKLRQTAHAWGGDILVHGGARNFTITLKGVPEEECQELKTRLEAAGMGSSLATVLCRDGNLAVVAK